MRSIRKLFLFWLILTLAPCLKGWAQPANSMVISELMINPNNVASLPAYAYIELYNNGNTSINLNQLTLHINTNQVTLPSKLFSDKDILVDSVYYNSNMHAAHIVQPKGISLERLSPAENIFHSASTLVGGATPGYRNSTDDLDIKKNRVYLQSQTLSPNDDGNEDDLIIHYELMHPNYIIAVELYNEKGQLMKKLAHQNVAGTHGTLSWDGRNDNGQRCIKGHYICYTKIFNPDGNTQNFKQPFVLINSLTRY